MTSAATSFSLTGPLPQGRVAIEASAGTGKTYTLASLVVRYVAEAAVPIDELLIVTFTRAAAAELRDRVRSRLTEAVDALRKPADQQLEDTLFALMAGTDRERRLQRLERAVVDFDAATITTIHSFAQQVLATLGSAAPGDLDATLVDDTNELVTSVCADLLAAEAVSEPMAADQLPAVNDLAKLVAKVLGNPGICVIPGPNASESTPAAARRRRLLDRAIGLVHHRRRQAGTLSFDDLLTQLRDSLLASPATVAVLRRRYRIALIDEFQDTDPVQWMLFSTLFGGAGKGSALVLVADPKQAIYAFRGANVHTYLDAAGEPGTERSTLGVNWRSDEALLGALERLLGGATFGDPRIGFVPVEAARLHKSSRLTSRDGSALPALCIRAAVGSDLPRTKPGQIPTPDANAAVARDLARHIQQLLETASLPWRSESRPSRPLRPGDVAVLIGRHSEVPAIQRALRQRGIPAVVARGESVLRSEAFSHWRWLLTALTWPADPTRARTAALSWFFGWTLERVATADDNQLSAVQEDLAQWAEVLGTHGVVDFCAKVWTESGVAARVLADADGDRHLTDLDHISGLLQMAVSGRRPTAAGLLAALDQLDDNDPENPEEDVTARRVESEAEAVQIMTIWAAKGLEYPVVCVPTLWNDSYATARDVVFQDPGTKTRTLDIANGEQWPSKVAASMRKALATEEAVGDNLRLLYVALTRAQHQTVVWWSRARGSEVTGLARVLFARQNGTIDSDLFTEPKVSLPPDADVQKTLIDALGANTDAVDVAVTGLVDDPVAPWSDQNGAPGSRTLELAALDRTPDRTSRRWSFSAISDGARTLEINPEDDSLGDAGAADEGAADDAGEDDAEPDSGLDWGESGTDLPLGAVRGGAQFGTLVHEVLERVDFAAGDLEGELGVHVDDRLRWSPWPVEPATLVGGLLATMETPLGPLLGGHPMRDFERGDCLRELSFELRLGTSGRTATDRDIGTLALQHLPHGDPLRPWAEQLAGGLFRVELAGHLTGSIDVVFRVRDRDHPGAEPRFVVADYKTNTLGAPGRLPRSADYRPDLLPTAMAAHHYPLQALLYLVALHRYLRWRLLNYDPAVHLGGATYLFVRGMAGAATPAVDGNPNGVFSWAVPPDLVTGLSELLDGRTLPT
jgi:exodeoxyribonuclease V beta subunit